jgi:hypothetical protein
MKPPGRLKHIPSVIDERVGVVTIAVGTVAAVVTLTGVGLLVLDGTAANSSGMRLEVFQSAINGYQVWEFIRFGAQAGLGVTAMVAGVGLRDGWPWARRLAARYGVAALILQTASLLVEFGLVDPAFRSRGIEVYGSFRVVFIVAFAVLAVHALLLLVVLRETEPGPLVWETAARAPDGGIVVMPADVRRPVPAVTAPPRLSPRWRGFLFWRVLLPGVGVLFCVAGVWAGASLWLRPAPQSLTRAELRPHSTTATSSGADSLSATPPPAVAVPGFPQPSGAVRAFNASGSVRVITLGYAADGSTLVTVGRNGVVRLWNATSERPLAELTIPEPSPDGIIGAAVAPDGRTLAVATSEGPPRLYELPSLRERPPSPAEPGPGHPRGVAFAAAGHLAASDVVGIRVWEPDGRLRYAAPTATSGPFLAVSPDGRTVAVGGDVIRLYDLDTGVARPVLRWESGYLTGLVFSPDGALLAASSSTGTVSVWESTTGRGQGKLRQSAAIHSLAFTPDGRRLVAGTEAAALHTWVVAAGRSLGTNVIFQPPNGGAAPWYGGTRAIVFRPDGMEFAVACGGAVAVFPAAALPIE